MRDRTQTHEYVIIGAGPGGLQLAYYLARRRRDYVVLERGSRAGTFFESFPRHGKLISINKVHTGFEHPGLNMRWDWNSLLDDDTAPRVANYSHDYFPPAAAMSEYLNAFAEHHRLSIAYDSDVTSIDRDEHGCFHLRTHDGSRYECKYLISALGYNAPHIPDIPGIELAQDYSTMEIDKEAYTGAKVMILGKGNSAFETADHLSDVARSVHVVSPEGLKLAWQSHYVGDLRAANNNLLDTYQLKSQNTIIDGTVERIDERGRMLHVTIAYDHAMVDRIVVPVDHVITCTGFQFDNSIFGPSCRPDRCEHEKFPSLTSEWESTNVRNLYFAGTLMHGRDYRKTFSGFIHGFRYNVEKLDRILDIKNHGGEMPYNRVERGGQGLARMLLERIHFSSSLFQQPKFLADVVLLGDENECLYYRDIGLDYLLEGRLFPVNREFLTLTAEYGETKHPDPFNIQNHPTSAAESNFLHPVVRLYSDGHVRASFHFMEDLENNWYQQPYLEAFSEFLREKLSWRGLDPGALQIDAPDGYADAATVALHT